MHQEDVQERGKKRKGFSGFIQDLLGITPSSDETCSELPPSDSLDNDGKLITSDEPGEVPSAEIPSVEGASEEPPPILAPDSALFRLWNIWCTQQPSLATSPNLLLPLPEETSPPLFTEKQLSFEQRSLERNLEKLAAARCPAQEQLEVAYEEAQCYVHLASTEMAVWLYLFPPIGDGTALTVDDFITALGAERVNSGIDYALLALLETEPQYFTPLLIASGTAPIPGKDGYLKEYFQRYHIRTVEMDERGNVDYRAQSYTQNILKDGVICDIIPPEPGTDGCTVCGKSIPAKAPVPAAVPVGTNTKVSEDKTQLLSTMDGHVIFSNNVFHVKPLLEISGDVDYSNGNINFKGDVHIRGNVRENFTVIATGTITVDGMVEAAVLEAGADIIISSGVLGDHKAVVKAKKNVRAKYLESCVVYSGECTYADCIISSQVYSDNRISVLTGRGTVIGGSLTAANRVDATVIGSKAGRRTDVHLGVFPYIHEEYVDNQTALSILQNDLAELKKRIAYFENNQNTEKNAKFLADSRLQNSVLTLKISKLEKRQEEIEAKSPDLAACRLECGTIYPTTSITIGSANEVIDTVWKKCVAVYDSREHVLRFL